MSLDLRATCNLKGRPQVFLEQLGWNSFFAAHLADQHQLPARVTEVLKGHYRVTGEEGAYLAQLSGAFCFEAETGNELPAVGDWVCIEPQPEGRAIIHALLPR